MRLHRAGRLGLSLINASASNSVLRHSRADVIGSPSLYCRELLRHTSTASSPTHSILVDELIDDGIALIRLNRPSALNALSSKMCSDLIAKLEAIDQDKAFRSIIITGNGKAFAAGADIREMVNTRDFATASNRDLHGGWKRILNIRKPIIAAVNGYALGGGCELAMMCDIIVAARKAKFGQPEIKLGTIPAMGGTQRLIRAVGKSKAMEWILTGDQFGAEEALKFGLISHVFDDDQLEEEAIKIARKIASYSHPSVTLAKECVNRASEVSLQEGLLYERRVFQSTFGLKDRAEGMNAFVSKTAPQWEHR